MFLHSLSVINSMSIALLIGRRNDPFSRTVCLKRHEAKFQIVCPTVRAVNGQPVHHIFTIV